MLNASVEKYGRGENAVKVTIGDRVVWFSYKTPVAFKVAGGKLVVRQNDWRNTTGAHLNAIDRGNVKDRVDGPTFEKLFAEAMEAKS